MKRVSLLLACSSLLGNISTSSDTDDFYALYDRFLAKAWDNWFPGPPVDEENLIFVEWKPGYEKPPFLCPHGCGTEYFRLFNRMKLAGSFLYKLAANTIKEFNYSF
jgi:hypothetical protein